MIVLNPYDAGTKPMRLPGRGGPGCDDFYYRHVRMEEQQFEDRRVEIDAGVREVTPLAMDPWPEPLPGKMWVDWSNRHESSTDGLPFSLYHFDTADDSDVIVPAGYTYLDRTPDEILDLREGRTGDRLSYSEVTELRGPGWYRNPTRNENGGTQLKQPVRVVFDGVRGSEYRLELGDSTLWTPFDLRLGLDAYRGFWDDGTPATDAETKAALAMTQRSRWALYLVPRRWRWVVFVVAHFLYITPFETVPNDEYFIKSYFDRPPVYPYRHDVLYTSTQTDLEDYFGNPRSYDIGIDYAFTYSRAGADLASEILAQQYWAPCIAYVFIGHEMPSIALWAHPPRESQIAVGLGRLDAGGDESRIWLRQIVNLDSVYPRRVIGEFLSVMWQVVP